MENFHPIFTLHISCFGIQGTPKNMICHYFLQEGGGSSLDHLFIIYVVIIGLRREGGKPNLHVFIKYPVFFLEGAPNEKCENLTHLSCLEAVTVQRR